MELKAHCYYLFFLIISTFLYLAVGDGFPEGQTRYNELDFSESNQNNIEDILDRKLKPLQKIIFDLQDTMIAKMQIISGLEYDINRKMNEIKENILLELTMNITKKINDRIESASEQHQLLESTDNINRRLVVIQNDMQDGIINKLEKITRLEYDLKRSTKEIVDNVLSEQAMNITRQINNKIDTAFKDTQTPVSSDNLNNRLAALESKLEIIESQRNSDMKNLADKMNMLTTNVMQFIKKSDSACKEKNTVEIFENKVNNNLDAMKNYIAEKLEILENNRNRDMKELTKQINLLNTNTTNTTELSNCDANQNIFNLVNQITKQQTKNITEQVTDSMKSVSKDNDILELMENMNKKLIILENIPKLEKHIVTLMNMSRITQKVAEQSNQTAEDLKNNTLQSHLTDSGYDKITSICNVTVPSWVKVRSDIWKDSQTPEEDDLDNFFVNKTGCSYKGKGGKYAKEIYSRATFDGTLFEWRGAVRGREDVVIDVYWGGRIRYSFVIGYDGNQKTFVYEPSTSKEWYLSTPDILSPERYEWFYVRIRAGTLTFGRECDRAPLDTRDVTVQRGEEVKMKYWTNELLGAKFLYDCPANVAGRAGA